MIYRKCVASYFAFKVKANQRTSLAWEILLIGPVYKLLSIKSLSSNLGALIFPVGILSTLLWLGLAVNLKAGIFFQPIKHYWTNIYAFKSFPILNENELGMVRAIKGSTILEPN